MPQSQGSITLLVAIGLVFSSQRWSGCPGWGGNGGVKAHTGHDSGCKSKSAWMCVCRGQRPTQLRSLILGCSRFFPQVLWGGAAWQHEGKEGCAHGVLGWLWCTLTLCSGGDTF